MNGDIELQHFRTDRDEPFNDTNSQNEHTVRQQVTAGPEDHSSHDTPEATEDSHLLPVEQSNGVRRIQRGGTGRRSYVVMLTLERDPNAGQDLLNSVEDTPLAQELDGAAATGVNVDGAPCSQGGPRPSPVQECRENHIAQNPPGYVPLPEQDLLNSVEDTPLAQELDGAAASGVNVDGALCSQGGPRHSPVLELRVNHIAQNPSGYVPLPEQPESENGRGVEGLLWRLNRRVVGRLRLWMVIAFVVVLIAIAAITLGLVLWEVLYEDEDDKYDRKSFVVPLLYSGSLRLVNQNFSNDLLSPTSNHSRALSSLLVEKVAPIYHSSPALGRYFSGMGVYAFRNGSVTAYYWLKFLMPLEHEQLLRFTISREMVYNVLRQRLYDQEPDSNTQLHIDPSAIYMQVGNITISD